MSSLSTGFNSIAAVVLEDWVRSMGGWTLTERQTSWTLRGVVVVVGVVTFALMFVVEHLGMVFQVSPELHLMRIRPAWPWPAACGGD